MRAEAMRVGLKLCMPAMRVELKRGEGRAGFVTVLWSSPGVIVSFLDGIPGREAISKMRYEAALSRIDQVSSVLFWFRVAEAACRPSELFSSGRFLSSIT
eukprot:6200462-Pleurochrysis_carterae.AAC.3